MSNQTSELKGVLMTFGVVVLACGAMAGGIVGSLSDVIPVSWAIGGNAIMVVVLAVFSLLVKNGTMVMEVKGSKMLIILGIVWLLGFLAALII